MGFSQAARVKSEQLCNYQACTLSVIIIHSVPYSFTRHLRRKTKENHVPHQRAFPALLTVSGARAISVSTANSKPSLPPLSDLHCG